MAGAEGEAIRDLCGVGDGDFAIGGDGEALASGESGKVGFGEGEERDGAAVELVGDDGSEGEEGVGGGGEDGGGRSTGFDALQQDGGGGGGAARERHGEDAAGGDLAGEGVTAVDDLAGVVVVAAP